MVKVGKCTGPMDPTGYTTTYDNKIPETKIASEFLDGWNMNCLLGQGLFPVPEN